MKKMPVVEVIWEDATGGDGWISRASVEKKSLAPIPTVGYVVKEDKKTLTLSMCSDELSDLLGAYLVIPKVNIISRKTIRK